MNNFFEITHKDSSSKARTGIIHTTHGDIQTPAFAVVGTKATVKGLTPEQLRDTQAQIMLANTYHLYLRPGEDVVEQGGKLAKFSGWNGPTMTDSGGFQVFSLGEAFGTKVTKIALGDEEVDNNAKKNKLATIDEEGVTFKSHIDGAELRLTPEKSMEIQFALGADMIFAFDECTSPHATKEYQTAAMERTHRWALRCLDRHNKLDTNKEQFLFGVVQGGREKDLRLESAKILSEMKTAKGDSFDGFGIGGSFNKDDLQTAVGWVTDVLPDEKPRHLLGIGDPIDIVKGVQEGIDLFDCVAPTRNARNGSLYTKTGRLNIENTKWRNDQNPIEVGCDCYTCKHFTLSYLSHLYHSKELLINTLLSIHNIRFIVRLVDELRDAIKQGTLESYSKKFLEDFQGN